jgi:hypothetical protein
MSGARVQLICIGGAQRSGTTLLQTLLANALDAANLPEAHILCDLMASYKRAKDSPNKTRYYYATDQELLAFFRACAERHIADIAERFGGTTLVLKDPNFVQFDAEAAAMLPDAIRIALLRDPRDIAASFLRIGQREPQEGEAGKYRRRDIHFICKKILTSYASLMQEPEPPNVCLVRYEALVNKPQDTLKDLARDTGLKFSLASIDNPVWLEAEARHETPWIGELEGQGPSAASVGGYRTLLRPREIALIEQLCAPLMAWAGYEMSDAPRSQWEEAPGRLARDIVNRIRRRYWSYRGRFPQL